MRREILYSGLSPSLKAHHAGYFSTITPVPGSSFAHTLASKDILWMPDTAITTLDILLDDDYDMLLLEIEKTLQGHAAFHKKKSKWDVFSMDVSTPYRKQGHATHMAKTLLWMAEKPVQFRETDESMARLCSSLEKEGYQREDHLIYPKNE